MAEAQLVKFVEDKDFVTVIVDPAESDPNVQVHVLDVSDPVQAERVRELNSRCEDALVVALYGIKAVTSPIDALAA